MAPSIESMSEPRRPAMAPAAITGSCEGALDSVVDESVNSNAR